LDVSLRGSRSGAGPDDDDRLASRPRGARGHALLTRDLAELTDADLERPVLTNWGEEWPAWRIFWTMIDHDAHHGAEIGVLRDLYRLRATGANPASG
jgi:hypothetical protein